jgi:hypothetical protein
LRKGTLLAAVVVYVVYFVFSWNQPLAIPGLAGHGPLVAFAGRLLMPPWLFLRGLGWVALTAVRPSYLFGHPYPHGIWFFFPVLLVLKSLPGFLGLLVLTLALAFWHRGKRPGEAVIPVELASQWRAIWVSLLVFVAICLISPMDLSIRHFSVPLVLLTLLMAPLPRLIESSTRRLAWSAAVLAAVLAASCLITAVRIYPYYLQYASPLGMGRPHYWLMSDSNVDWNQALPEVEGFVRKHGLTDAPLDFYGLSASRAVVPQARLWDCQAPADSDAGRWVFVSANMILDSHNCAWIMQYPHEALADGGMYAIRLPSPIPAAGSAGGPPLPAARRNFLNAPVDMRAMFLQLTNHPEEIQKELERMMAEYQKALAEAKRKKGH